MRQSRWDLRNIAAPFFRAGQRRLVIDSTRGEASQPEPVRPLARLVSEALLGALIFVSVLAVFYAWLANAAWSLTAAIIATGLARAAGEWAAAAETAQRRRRSRIQRVLRETATMIATAGTDGFLAALTRCLHRLDYERPQIQPGFGSGGEGMVVASNGEHRVAIYYIVDGSAVLDSDAVIIAASELARVESARHYFATTGEFTPVAYQRAERVGITLIDRYELVGLFAADEARSAMSTPSRTAAQTAPGPNWRADPESVSQRLADNRRRVTGHARVALLLVPIALLSRGPVQVYLLALVAVNMIALAYRQWLSFRLLTISGGDRADGETAFPTTSSSGRE